MNQLKPRRQQHRFVSTNAKIKTMTITIKQILFAVLSILLSTIVCGQTIDSTNNFYGKNTISSDSVLQTGWYKIADSNNGFKRLLDTSFQKTFHKDTLSFFINPTPIVTAKNIIKTYIQFYNSQPPMLIMTLDKAGTKSMNNIAKNTVGKKFAFIADNKLLQVSYISYPLYESGTYLRCRHHDYTKEREDANELAKIEMIINAYKK